jgi:ATP-dependent Lon protease
VRLIVSRTSGWIHALSCAKQILAPVEDETVLHAFSVHLVADAAANGGHADLSRVSTLILSDSSASTRALGMALPAMSYECRKQLNEKRVTWRFPLLRALARHVAIGSTTDQRSWIDVPAWLNAAEVVAEYRDNSDLVSKRDLLLKDIPKSGFQRRFARPPDHAIVEALVEEFPNFAQVIEHTADQLAIAALGNGQLRLPPTLLLGDPGIGKSLFADRLAAVLGVKSRTFSMSHATQGGALGGLSSYWGTGSTGEVFNTLLRGKELNPVCVLDEIDKAAGTIEGRHNPLGPLYSLLEPEDAKQFVDEYLGVPIDASWFSWVATANQVDVLPAPIVSRLTVFEVRAPTRTELREIGRRQYRRLLESFGLGEHLPPEAPAKLLDQVEVSPRELRVLIQSAIGRMARDHMSGHSRSVELRETRLPQKRKMGFL